MFTSASTTVFKTFACDHDVSAGDTYLRADYSISCETRSHVLFQVYAGIMIVVSRLVLLPRDRGGIM